MKTETKYDLAKKKMIQGLITLLERKDFLDIGVKELCQEAGVNRSTFYAHYDNTFELLEDCRAYMVDTFIDIYAEKERESFAQGERKKNYITRDYILPYLKQIKKNRIIYETYQKLHLSMNRDEGFEALLANLAMPVARKNDPASKEYQIRYITKFYIEGINAIIRLWIQNGMKENEEEICDLITDLMIKKEE